MKVSSYKPIVENKETSFEKDDGLTFHMKSFYGGGTLGSSSSFHDKDNIMRFQDEMRESLKFRVLLFLEQHWSFFQKEVYDGQLPYDNNTGNNIEESIIDKRISCLRDNESLISIPMISLAILFYEYRDLVSIKDAYLAIKRNPTVSCTILGGGDCHIFLLDILKYTELF